jgi:hypothetical protein
VIKDGQEAKLFFQHIAAEMRVETLWNSVTTKDNSWSHQNETRLLALNNLKDPHLTIHNATVKPRLELPQPLLKQSLTEIMIGPNADAGAEIRVRAFLDRNRLSHVPVTHSRFLRRDHHSVDHVLAAAIFRGNNRLHDQQERLT